MLHITRGAIPGPPPPRKHLMHTTQRALLEGSSDAVVEPNAPTHTHANNITYTQQGKFRCLLFKLLLDFESILIGYADGRDVQKLHFDMDLYMHTTTILEHHMSLIIFDIDLGVQGMEDIC
jgi:hypothetical protein